VAKLQNSDSLKNVMAKIDEFSAVVRKPNELIGTGTLTHIMSILFSVLIFLVRSKDPFFGWLDWLID
jgi:hypothetical protein